MWWTHAQTDRYEGWNSDVGIKNYKNCLYGFDVQVGRFFMLLLINYKVSNHYFLEIWPKFSSESERFCKSIKQQCFFLLITNLKSNAKKDKWWKFNSEKKLKIDYSKISKKEVGQEGVDWCLVKWLHWM